MDSPIVIISKLRAESLSMVTQMVEKGLTPDVVLLSEAVYMLMDKKSHSSEVKKVIKRGARFFALSEDASKRGIKNLINDAETIDYVRLVNLLLEKSRSIINL